MLKIKNRTLYIHHIIKITEANLPRFWLAMLGLIVGFFILMVGNVLLDAYLSRNMQEVNQFAERTVLVEVGTNDYKIFNEIVKYDTNNATKVVYAKEKTTIFWGEYTNGYDCILNADIVSMSAVHDGVITSKYDGEKNIPIKGELIKGRWINEGDVANAKNVVIIDEFTSQILFGEENPLGKMIQLKVGNPEIGVMQENLVTESKNKEVVVIGVIGNDYNSKNMELNYNKFLYNGTENIILNTQLIVPETFYDNENENEYSCSMIWTYNSKEEYEEMIDVLEKYKIKNSDKLTTFNIVIKDELVDSVTRELKPLKNLIIIVLICLFVISGISMLSIMIFFVKERIGEIGIKKAFGATKLDIVLQFMFEGIIMSVMASIIAIFLGIIVSHWLGVCISRVMYIIFDVQIRVKNILFVLKIAVLYGVLFSLIPSYYGAKMKITDALRYE